MKQVVVAVRDAVADVFGRPYFVGTVGLAVRSFTDEVNRVAEDNPLNKHSKDFALYELGTYDDASGNIMSHEHPKHIISAEQCKSI